MKTFYTLLLAFGLCFTIHAQENVAVLNYDSYLQQQPQEVRNEINSYVSGTPSKLLLEKEFPAKHLWQTDQGSVVIDIVNTHSVNETIVQDNNADFNNAKALVISNVNANSQVIEAIDLSSFTQLKYIIVQTNQTMSATAVAQLLQNVQLPVGVLVFYKVNIPM